MQCSSGSSILNYTAAYAMQQWQFYFELLQHMLQWQFYFELVPLGAGVSYYQGQGRASLLIVNPGLSYPTVNQG